MDVRLSPEQDALRASVAQVVERLCPTAVAQLGDPERCAKLDAAVTESGWRELRTGNDDGSPLASGVESALVAEELGRGAVDTPFVGPVLAAELRRLAGVTPGPSLETVALDPQLSVLSQSVDGTAVEALGIDAAGCSVALLAVPEGAGYRVAQVELGAPSPGPDLTRPARHVVAGSAVEAVLGGERRVSADDLTRWTALGLALASADLVGTMRGAVQLACAYATERRQYGVAIGSFQSIAHLLADAHVMTEGAHSITLHAAWAVDALPAEEALAAAAMAKAYSARAARRVCETAIQVHGGIGNTWECMAHVFLRRALVSSALLGDEGTNLSRVLAHEGIGGRRGLR